MEHQVVSRDEWLAARKAHLEAEKELTRQRDKLLAERRALPWVKVDEPYVFAAPEGHVSLAELFDGRSQLFVQHFMLGPGWQEGCGGCSFMADHVDAARQHFEHADLTFVAVSRAPLQEIDAFKRRMGWRFRWVSSFDSDFNYDFRVSFTEAEMTSGDALYNYGSAKPPMEELHGCSVFCKDEQGAVYHTYSTYARGAESLIGAFGFLDMVPKGRNETTVMDWVRLHDRYEDATVPACHSAAE